MSIVVSQSSNSISSSVSHNDVNQAIHKMTADSSSHISGEENADANNNQILKMRKVSPVRRFFCSIKVQFSIIIIFFILLGLVVCYVSGLLFVMTCYVKMDALQMQELVQNAVGGVQHSAGTFLTRNYVANELIGLPVSFGPAFVNNPVLLEQTMAKLVYGSLKSLTENTRMLDSQYWDISYDSVPYSLVMVWDPNWTERLVYYRPCKDPNNRTDCELVDRKDVFVDYDGGNFSLKYKDLVPDYFKKIKDIKPTHCYKFGKCVGIAVIPNDQGGSMMFHLSAYDGYKNPQVPAFKGWYILWGFNMLFLNRIQSNRTGLCVSSYSSLEKNNLPIIEKAEFEKKTKNQLNLIPNDITYDEDTHVVTYNQNTDAVTMAQEYYITVKSEFVPPDRWYCDPSYDRSGKCYTKTYTYLSYQGFDLQAGKSTNDTTYMIRLDYHDPLTTRLSNNCQKIVAVAFLLWVTSVALVVLIFHFLFLGPLDKMRKMRVELIKTTLAGIDEDGTLVQDLFGDMIDDSALIEANGDVITVMRTLQDRVHALYSSIIASRTDDLARLRANGYKRLNAQKVMNFFMRRDDDNLRTILPGLMDSNEVSRRFRRTTVIAKPEKDQIFGDLLSARHSFRSLKAILNDDIATEFFKAFCSLRGHSTVNSLFFLMDVGWLHQVENAARSDADDFLANLFNDSVPQSPTQSPKLTLKVDEGGAGLSGSLMNPSASELLLPPPESDRPHHSHFAKSKEAPSSGSTGKKTDDDSPKKKKISPIIISKNSTPSDSPKSSPPSSPRTPQNNDTFMTKNGEAIAHFIRESYFGHRSLAQRDLKHSALIGCSQIHDYIMLRDKEDLVYTPIMFNNLVTVITKKFTSDIVPEFLNSSTFQMMVYSLVLIDFFEKGGASSKADHFDASYLKLSEEERNIDRNKGLVGGLLSACVAMKKKEEDENDDDDDDSSTSDDEDDDEDEKKKKESNDKEEEKEKDKKNKENGTDNGDDNDGDEEEE